MEGRSPGDHFFPAFVGQELQWGRPLQQNTYLKMIRVCVSSLGLESGDPDKVQLYSSTSIRTGNTNLTEEAVARYRAQRNKEMGWVKDSTVPLTHYTSDSVALAPGPLFWDIAACDANYDLHVHDIQLRKFTLMLCTQCGAPFPQGAASCGCRYCVEKAKARAAGKSTNPKGRHTCWKVDVNTSGVMPEG